MIIESLSPGIDPQFHQLPQLLAASGFMNARIGGWLVGGRACHG
jgi:hypothetical protein